jgi:HAD superfamily hydrolase (TIGR01490 family)
MTKVGKKFAVFDIDGTLIRWQLFHAIVHHLGKEGYIDSDDFKTIKNSMMAWKDRSNQESFDEYEETLVNIYIKSLPGIKPSDYSLVVDQVFEQYKDQLFVFTRDMLKRLKSEGYFIIAISGSQHEIVQKLANYHGFDVAVGAKLEINKDKYTGKIVTPIFDKKATLTKIISKYNLSNKGSIGVGDTKSDIALLKYVEHPIAFNPNLVLYKEAVNNGWQIIIERKNVVYELNSTNGKYILDGSNYE